MARDGWAWLLLHLLGHQPGQWRPELGRESALTQPAFAYDLHLHANHRWLRTYLACTHTVPTHTYAHTRIPTLTHVHIPAHLANIHIFPHIHIHASYTCTHSCTLSPPPTYTPPVQIFMPLHACTPYLHPYTHPHTHTCLHTHSHMHPACSPPQLELWSSWKTVHWG